MRTLLGKVLMTTGFLCAPMLAGSISAHADDPRGTAVVTIRTGALTVELFERHSWTIGRILYKGAAVGRATGSYGVVISIPAVGGWVGAAHTEGGIEQVQEISLTVDGEPAQLSDGAVYACQRAELSKHSMLDKVRLDATVTFESESIVEHHVLTAIEDVVISRVYPFMHCVTSATKEWMALTYDGRKESGKFTESDKLQWHSGWQWTAAYDPISNKGLLLRYLEMPADVEVQTGYWDQQRDHKLYAQLMTDDIIKEETVLDSRCIITCFDATPDAWQDRAREVAAELVAP